MKTRIRWIGGLVFLVFFIGSAQAENDDLTPLKSVPDAQMIAPIKTPSPQKSQSFDGQGTLNGFGEDSVVIDDAPFTLAPNAKFYAKDGRRTLKHRFSAGIKVGYVLGGSAEETTSAFATASPYPVIASLWVIDKKAGGDEN